MTKSVFALVDCNNFYASCEKLFRPDLRNTPVVVLSNNDACIVARCALAKALGFKMAAPYFQVKDELARKNVAVFSSNYALYGDISSRVLTAIESMVATVTPYSIDESWALLSDMHINVPLEQFGKQLRARVQQWTGITTCVGISTTKTLAKLANTAAKQYPATGGVVDLCDPARQRRLMALMPVGEVWGVGGRYEEKLRNQGIETALQLAQADPKMIRSRFSVVLERTLRELNGECCLEIEDLGQVRQQVVCGRSFGEQVDDIARMRQLVSTFIGRAVEKLRQEKLTAQYLSLAIRTNSYNPDGTQRRSSAGYGLAVPSNDTREFTALAMRLLATIWREGGRYSKAEIMLSDIRPVNAIQGDLFAETAQDLRQVALMKVVDEINLSGKGRVFLARQGMKEDWGMRQEFLSPAYTTRWEDLPVVR